MKKFNLKKKGQIGTTLTWIIAFGLILFILFLFIVITIAASAGKSLKIVDLFTSYGKNEIDLLGNEVKTSDYNINKELHSVINEKIGYKGGEARIIDLFRYYSYNKEEETFNLFDDKLKNYFDILYDECYSFCLFINDGSGTKINKQITGGKCNDFESSCEYLDNLPFGELYKRGSFMEKNDFSNYEIKLYTKGENDE